MKYLEVQHKYVVLMPEDAFDSDDWESILNTGVSLMEEHMKKLSPNMRDLMSSWQVMPNRYLPSVGEDIVPEGIPEGVSDEEAQVSFFGPGAAQVKHPWEEGMYIFPLSHPLRSYEEAAREAKDEDAGQKMLEARRKELNP